MAAARCTIGLDTFSMHKILEMVRIAIFYRSPNLTQAKSPGTFYSNLSGFTTGKAFDI